MALKKNFAVQVDRVHEYDSLCFAAAVCFGDGTFDHCGLDRSRKNYWVSVVYAYACLQSIKSLRVGL